MSLLKTKKDKELFAKWNKKLEKYDDCNIEDFSKPDVPLKKWARKLASVPLQQYEDTSQYYETARALLHTHKFQNAWHRKIWALHCEGYFGREIKQMINNRFSKTTIDSIIRTIKKEAGIGG